MSIGNGVPLSDMEKSESQEQLHSGGGNSGEHGRGSDSSGSALGGVHVAKTTEVTTMCDSRSNGSMTDLDTFGDGCGKQQVTPWTVGR